MPDVLMHNSDAYITSQLQVNLSPTNGSLLFCAVGLKSWMLPFMGNVSSGGLIPSKDLS